MQLNRLVYAGGAMFLLMLLVLESVAAETRITISSVPLSDGKDAGAAVVPFGVTRRDADLIQSSVPGLANVIPVREAELPVRYLDRSVRASVTGTTRDFEHVARVELAAGRFLNKTDLTKRNNVAVLSAIVAEDLFSNDSPLGKTIRIENEVFEIVGTLRRARADNRNLSRAVIVPVTTMKSRLGDLVLDRSRGVFKATQFELSRLELIPENPETLSRAKTLVQQLMKRQHAKEDYKVEIVVAATTPTAQLTTNSKQPASQLLLESGMLESAQEKLFSSKLPGESRVARIVPDGSAIKRGEVLFELQNDAVAASVETARQRVRELQSQLFDANQEQNRAAKTAALFEKTGSIRVEIAELQKDSYFGPQGEHSVKEAQLKRLIRSAEDTLNVAVKLEADARRARNDVAAAEAGFRRIEAEQTRDNAKDELALLKGPLRALKTRTFELAISQARAEFELGKAEVQQQLEKAQNSSELAEVEVAAAQKRLKEVMGKFAGKTVTAPFDGIAMHVTRSSRRSTEQQSVVGAVVQERQQIIKVVNPNRLQARISVHESKARNVRVGQKCVLRIDAIPSQEFPGTVQKIANVPTPAAWPRTQVSTYTTIISFDKAPPALLKIGMTCEVRIKTD